MASNDKEIAMPNPRSVCPKTPPHLAFLQGARAWYRAWVRMREARYRYLAAILDGDAEHASTGHLGADARSDGERTMEKRDGAT